MRARVSVLVVLFLSLACASTPKTADRPAAIARPEVVVHQESSIFFGSGLTAPVSLEVEVGNNADVPLRVRKITIEATGMSEYSIYPVQKFFNEEIPPGQARSFNVVATAYTNVARLTPSEPLAVRSTVEFEAGQTRFHEITFQRSTM